MDTISSILVLWRFWGGGKTVSEEELATREKRASIAIALTFILLAATVMSVASVHLSEQEAPKDVEILLILAVPSVLIFGTLGGLKLWVGATFNLDSPSLRKDGYCSVCGAIMSVGVMLGASLDLGGEAVWWLDSTIAIVIAAGLLAVGARSVAHNIQQGNRFWTVEFWHTPGGITDGGKDHIYSKDSMNSGDADGEADATETENSLASAPPHPIHDL